MDYQLWLGDCLEEMDRIDDGSIDAIIADWPYGRTNCSWDSVIPLEPLWKQCKRVIKPRGAIVLTASQPFTSMLVMSNLEWFKYEWVWDKRSPTGFLNVKKMPMQQHNNILIFSSGPTTYNPQYGKAGKPFGKGKDRSTDSYGSFGDTVRNGVGYPKSILSYARPNNLTEGHNLHPTQKPLALLEYLIKTYTNEGETVLDNTFGSCSTGEACLRTGRRFIGIEKDANYFRIGQERMERVAAELRGKLTHLPMFQEIAA